MVFVTHDQTEALTMADRIAVLNFGKMQQIDSPKALYEAPASAFVASFIGETNFWPATAQADAAACAELTVELEGGERAVVIAADAVRRGQAVRVAIRPENIHLDAVGAGCTATVDEAIYAGSVTTLLMRSKGPLLRVRFISGSGAIEPAPGTIVTVQWEARHARAYAVA